MQLPSSMATALFFRCLGESSSQTCWECCQVSHCSLSCFDNNLINIWPEWFALHSAKTASGAS